MFSFVQILVNFRQILRKCRLNLLFVPLGFWLNPGFAELSIGQLLWERPVFVINFSHYDYYVFEHKGFRTQMFLITDAKAYYGPCLFTCVRTANTRSVT